MDKRLLPPVKNLIHLKKILPVLIVLIPLFSRAQNQTPRVTPTSTIHYYEYLPPDYALNTDNYPILFFMHGIGERGNDALSLVNVAKNGPPKHVKNGFKFPFILISPQLKTTYGDWPPWYLDEVVEYCKTYLRIDPKRIYVCGLSLGGGGAWYYAQTYPDKVAALVPVCGSRNATSQACKLATSNIPVWAFHGDKDTVVPMSKSVNMVNAINACVPAPNPLALLTIYPGVGHNAWDNAYRTDNLLHTPNVYQWLMQWTNGGVTVNAGTDITLNLPTNSTNITGTASTESGTITSYAWTKVSGPAVTMANTTTPTLSLTGMVAGVYTFRLTATSSTGQTAYDDVKVTVISVNLVPVANAGTDKTITLPTSSLNLVGTGTDVDGTIASYAWTQVGTTPAIATLTNPNTATVSVSGLTTAGVYTFSLTVTDNQGATATDNVLVTVNPAAVNQAPTANAGVDKTVNLPTSTTNLAGSGSDPDGTITGYLWEKVSGPTVTMTNTTTATVSLASLVAGSYTFRLTVTDNQGATGIDLVNVTVVAANQSPVANAGVDITITQPTSTTNITGTGSDPDGTIASYAWTQVGTTPTVATLTNPSATTVTVSGLTPGAFPGVYTFRLTVTDNQGSTAFDDVKVTVNAAPVNVVPTANAGPDKSITLPVNSATFNGSGTDSDGTIASYSWTKQSGPTASLTGASTATLQANSLVEGTYVFRLTVTDNQGATAFDDVTIVVQPAAVNQIPVANAGSDVVITLPTSGTTLNGAGTDADGTISSYAWIKLSGPSATLTGASTATLQVADMLTPGTYVFQLAVTDDDGATDTDDVTVTVNAANVPPTANAGADITLNLPTSSADITGSGSDSDGTIASYAWVQVGATPAVATLTNPTSATVSVSGLTVAGVYTFRLTVTDDDTDTGSDEVKVIVNAANLAPTANAGADQTITLPTNSANFTASGTDPDGTIASYNWTEEGGSSATLTNATSQTLTVTVPGSGTFTFRVTITDNGGAIDYDDVVLTVNPAAVNQAPTANAGANQTITLPVNSLNLSGSGSDPDGTIASYLWTKTSGPSATITNATSSTVSLSNLVEGSYVFRLTVTDNGVPSPALSAFSEVTVTVLPAAINQPPTANAGADQTITLPTDFITIFGSGSDADGTVVTYQWTQTGGAAVTTSDPTKPDLTLLPSLAAGTYDFKLEVTDEDGATAVDNVRVTVNPMATNQAPVANAGSDKTITLPTNITNLNGSGSDADGDPITYSWVKVSGPAATLNPPTTAATLSVSNLVEGIYIFRLEVRDDDGAVDTDDVTVNVLPAAVNQPPVVSAGSDKNLFPPANSSILSGSASDADGTIGSYVWTQISGPSSATLVNANTPTLTVNNLVEGTYRFRLTATDDDNASAFDEVLVVLNAAATNQPPIANAGVDKTIKLPTNSTTLTGTGTDPDGSIASYAWTKVSGPTVTLTNQNTATVSLSDMNSPGTYEFMLTVTDNATPTPATATDLVIVTVLPASINSPPVANAGPDVTVLLPTNSTSITGTSTDDGTIASITWTQVSGPNTASITGGTTNTATMANLIEGTYVFRFFIEDDGGLNDFDDVSVTVVQQQLVSAPPTVEADPDLIIQLPVNFVSLTAVANSEDGLIESYQWTQTFGAPANMGVDTTNILDITDLVPGEYEFKITVTDGLARTASDSVHVTVLEEEPVARPSNSFSANGDGNFDTWAIENSFLLDACDIVVYNRQGMKVYESKGYSTEWDGVFNGKPLPEGVYFYVIRCSGQKAITGSVTIIR